MATHRIPILNGMCLPDSSGTVFFEPASVLGTNGTFDHLVLVFTQGSSTRNGIAGVFDVPQNYVDTANLIIVWTSTATTNDVEWDFDYRAVGGNDAESLDQATAQEAVGSNDTAPSATDERMEFSLALTDGNFAAGDTVSFEFFRDESDSGDTMAASARVFGLMFEYNDA